MKIKHNYWMKFWKKADRFRDDKLVTALSSALH